MKTKIEIERIIIRLKNGEIDALKSLHEKFSTALYRTCRRYYLSHEDAEEVVQDVMLLVWEKRHELRTDLSFTAYISTIARHATFKKVRKKIIYYTIDNYLQDERTATPVNAEDEIIGVETEKIIETLIADLPAKKQKVYIMSRVEGLSHEEIAEKIGLSKRTVESHIYQTNLLIKQKLNLDSYAILLLSCTFHQSLAHLN